MTTIQSDGLPHLILRPGDTLAGLWWFELPAVESAEHPCGGLWACHIVKRASQEQWQIAVGRRALVRAFIPSEVAVWPACWTWTHSNAEGTIPEMTQLGDSIQSLLRKDYLALGRSGSISVQGDLNAWLVCLSARPGLLPDWLNVVFVERREVAQE